uniref:Uncharacterized protein n=1 Tax=Ochrobactrum phage ORM_20 TaxID=2985243 RepID=A0A9N6ZGH0_9VIRU|nr:hypothetical protein ORM20_00131 [Ochrobactrum phage ORM_20]
MYKKFTKEEADANTNAVAKSIRKAVLVTGFISYFQNTLIGKSLLRSALDGTIPAEDLNKVKDDLVEIHSRIEADFEGVEGRVNHNREEVIAGVRSIVEARGIEKEDVEKQIDELRELYVSVEVEFMEEVNTSREVFLSLYKEFLDTLPKFDLANMEVEGVA